MYGQIVIGAPGSGKTTYCEGMCQMLEQLKRPVVCINLDPANDTVPYKCDIDIRELISIEDVMSRLKLGPNGALRYCMVTLQHNLEWLRLKLKTVNAYLLIDFPGQLELYNSDDCITSIIRSMTEWGHRLVAVHLSDSLYCSDAGKFISVVLSALSVMINLECAQINVLSKQDLLRNDDLPFNFDFFEQLPDMQRVADLLQLITVGADLEAFQKILLTNLIGHHFQDNEILKKYKGLNEKVCSVINDYALVNFVALNILDKNSVLRLLKLADTANGYAYLEGPDLRNIVRSEKIVD